MALENRGGTAGTFFGGAGVVFKTPWNSYWRLDTLKIEVDGSDDVPDFNWRICLGSIWCMFN